MDRTRIRRQVERLLDEQSQQTLSIIVQGRHEGLRQAIVEAAERAIERRAVTNAADLLPPPAHERLAGHKAAVRRAADVHALRRTGIQAIEPMQQAAFVRFSRQARRSDEGGRMRALPLAGAAAMEIDRDDLAQLPEALPQALAVFANRRVPVPPRLRATALPPEIAQRSTHAWGIEASGALASWGAFGARGQGARVAVLDTGVEPSHPDLAGKVARFAEFDARGRLVAEGVDAAWDADGHGTHVCGTIAGGRASGRWIGMAPACRLLVAKVLGKAGGTDEQILKGMEWAVAEGADVINMSLGGLSFEPSVLDTYTSALIAARQAGIPCVVSVGNEGAQTSGSPGNDYFALAVGAMDANDRVAAFSAGRTQIVEESEAIAPRNLPLVYSKPDLGAPGVQVYSCIGRQRWEHLNGTSMAAPHVAGAIALLLSRTPQAKQGAALLKLSGWDRSDTLIQLIVGSVVDRGENGPDHRFGHGKLALLPAFGHAIDRGYLPKG